MTLAISMACLINIFLTSGGGYVFAKYKELIQVIIGFRFNIF